MDESSVLKKEIRVIGQITTPAPNEIIDLNSSDGDEKLREMITEKDQIIAVISDDYERLRKMAMEKNAEIARLKTTDWYGVTETLTKNIAEKDAEITSLNKSHQIAEDTIRRQYETIQLLRDKNSNLAARIQSLDSQLNSALAKLNRTEIENAINANNTKDAGRYRKLKSLFHKSIIAANGRRWWDCHVATKSHVESLDEVIDSIPEVQS